MTDPDKQRITTISTHVFRRHARKLERALTVAWNKPLEQRTGADRELIREYEVPLWARSFRVRKLGKLSWGVDAVNWDRPRDEQGEFTSVPG